MLFIILILSIVFVFNLYFKKKYSYWEKKGLKGPKPIWFVGNSLSELFCNPEKLEKSYLEKYGSCFGTYRGVLPNFNTSKPEHIKQILNDPNVFHSLGSLEINDNYVKNAILFRNESYWVNGRKAQTHFFTSKKIKSLFDHFESSINNLLENVDFIQNKNKTETVNLQVLAKHMCIDVVSKFLFSISINSYKERESKFVKDSLQITQFNKLNAIILNLLPKKLTNFLKINAFNLKVLNEVGDMFKKMVRKRENSEENYDDLIEIIKEANRTKNLGLTENEIIGNGLTGYFAGVNILSNAICSAIYHLLHSPEEKEKFTKEIVKVFSDGIDYEKLVDNSYIDAVISESMRLITFTKIFTRTAVVDTEIDGIKIEKGTEIKAINWIPSFSEEYFPNPEKFDPNRFLDKSSSNPNIINNSTYLPFGDGPKQCIGKRFSLVFMKYFLVKFFLNYDIYIPKDYKKELLSLREFTLFERFEIGLKKKTK